MLSSFLLPVYKSGHESIQPVNICGIALEAAKGRRGTVNSMID